jgi:hypothetical protein
MAEAGTSEDVLVAYVKNSTSHYDLSADQILYLRDVGLTSPVITAMLTRDSELKIQPQSVPIQPPPIQAPPVQTPAPTPPPSTPVEAPLTPPPSLEPGAMQAPAPAAAPVYVSSPPPEVGYFYDNLSPYGTWVQLDGVGWCWQPRVVVVNRAWQPYCDSGHWVYTDAGWFWQSDYSWGWAPFHYGRWHLHEHCGWVWLPDRVWGPAWVTWRYEGQHCGWAPLPPHADFDMHGGYRYNGVHVAVNFDFGLRPATFTFISLHDFNNHDYARHRLPQTQVTQIYNHTTVINNYVVNNNTVVNQGVKVEQVKEATHTEIKKVAIRDTPAWTPGSNTRPAGRTEVAVYRPELKAPAKPVNMVAQKVDNRHPVIQPAPIAQPKTQRPLVAESTSGVSRNSQGQISRPNTDHTQTPSQAQSTSRASRPVNKESSTTAAPTGTHTTSANSSTAVPATAKRPETERPQSNRAANGQNSSDQQNRPSHSSSTDDPRTSQGQSAQTYQANESRTWAQTGNARSSDSNGKGSGSSRHNSSSDSNKNSGGPSRKNDL